MATTVTNQDDYGKRKVPIILFWETRNHDPPENDSPHTHNIVYDDSVSQIPE